MVDWGPDGKLPCHIWFFVDLSELPVGNLQIEFGGIHIKRGVYAVVESAAYDERMGMEDPESELFVPLMKELMQNEEQQWVRKFYLADVEAFTNPLIVVPDLGGGEEAGSINRYFLVKPRADWKKMFVDWLEAPHHHDKMDPEEYESTDDEVDSSMDEQEEADNLESDSEEEAMVVHKKSKKTQQPNDTGKCQKNSGECRKNRRNRSEELGTRSNATGKNRPKKKSKRPK